MRPGSPPPRPRSGRPLGPTPRYAVIPRWGLLDPAMVPATMAVKSVRNGPSANAMRRTLAVTIWAFAAAALLHVVRYVLLIINRTVLLNPIVAGAGAWLGVVASVAAMLAVVGCAVVLTEWLIARRAEVFAHRGQTEPRSGLTLRAGCLVPIVNLLFAPLFVVELATAADRYRQLRRQIVGWWLLFVASTGMSVFATATAFTTDPQAIGDNHVSFIVAYLLGMAALIAVRRVVREYDLVPVEKPTQRWLPVREEAPPAGAAPHRRVSLKKQKAAALPV